MVYANGIELMAQVARQFPSYVTWDRTRTSDTSQSAEVVRFIRENESALHETTKITLDGLDMKLACIKELRKLASPRISKRKEYRELRRGVTKEYTDFVGVYDFIIGSGNITSDLSRAAADIVREDEQLTGKSHLVGIVNESSAILEGAATYHEKRAQQIAMTAAEALAQKRLLELYFRARLVQEGMSALVRKLDIR